MQASFGVQALIRTVTDRKHVLPCLSTSLKQEIAQIVYLSGKEVQRPSWESLWHNWGESVACVITWNYHSKCAGLQGWTGSWVRVLISLNSRCNKWTNSDYSQYLYNATDPNGLHYGCPMQIIQNKIRQKACTV